MATATLISRPIAILAMVVLARLLDPEYFGAIALAMVLFSTARLFSGLGMDNALIHNRREVSETGFQAFAVTCISSIVLFAVINLGLDFFAGLLGNVELAPILRWMSLLIIFDTLSLVPEAILRRQLKFDKIGKSLVAMTLTVNVVAVSLAFLGFGIWSLVWGQLIGSLAHMIIIWVASPGWNWLIPQQLRPPILRELLRYGIKSTSSGLVNFFNSNWDDWFVGRMLGMAALGFYSKAYALTNGTIAGLNTSILSGVFMPSYAQIQDDRPRLARAYLKALGLSAMFMAPLSMGVFAVAPELVSVLFGAKWLPMVAALQIFAFMALVRPLAASTSPLFRGMGHPEYDLQGGLVVLATMVPMIVYMVRWDIEGVAAAVTVSFIFGFFFNVYKLERLIPGVARKMIPAITPSLIASALMVAAVMVARPLLNVSPIGRYNWLVLFCLIAVGGIVFAVSGYLLQRDLIHELLQTLREVSKGNRLLLAFSRRLPLKVRAEG